ncbi:MAG: sulfite exporter TauE/SafE family protein [Ideonella sp.]|nr:sulfite exporter TauE/SafE family protein [Ideonella sp.]MCC7459612.1 sulfite exporter TauE/SafE family protein [Nitrospira sp.]
MPENVTVASALLVGLLGSPHCLGMCGGIVGTLSLAASGSRARQWGFLLAYNLGRIASYAAAGALLGALGSRLFDALPGPLGRWGAHLVSAAFMIALGLYLTGWWRGLAALERAGAHLWRRVEPLARRLLPVRHPAQALLIGSIWGFLPCGLVYTALAWSLAAGDAVGGAMLMAAFGAGTLPMLLVSGTASRALGAATRQTAVRRMSGVVVLAFGVYSLAAAGLHAGHPQTSAAASPAISADA